MEKEEIWKDIDGYEGLYEVSNLGKVRRVDGYDSRGRKWKGRILSLGTTQDGYFKVSLCKEGKQKWFMVHRLVAQAFIPNPEGLREINHKDEDKTNNLVDNLEYCDRKYNCTYGTRIERIVQTRIRKGIVDPDMCGLDSNERQRRYRQKNREKNLEKIQEYQREYYQKNQDQIKERRREQYQRLKKKQEEKSNRPSETSLW